MKQSKGNARLPRPGLQWRFCYLIDRISVSVICHPRPPDHRVFCSAGIPHHQLPAEKAA